MAGSIAVRQLKKEYTWRGQELSSPHSVTVQAVQVVPDEQQSQLLPVSVERVAGAGVGQQPAAPEQLEAQQARPVHHVHKAGVKLLHVHVKSLVEEGMHGGIACTAEAQLGAHGGQSLAAGHVGKGQVGPEAEARIGAVQRECRIAVHLM